MSLISTYLRSILILVSLLSFLSCLPLASSTSVSSSSSSSSSFCPVWRRPYPVHELPTAVVVKPPTAANGYPVSYIFTSLTTDTGSAFMVVESCFGGILKHNPLPSINLFSVAFNGVVLFTADTRDLGQIQTLTLPTASSSSAASAALLQLPGIDRITNFKTNDAGFLYAIGWPSMEALDEGTYGGPVLFAIDWRASQYVYADLSIPLQLIQSPSSSSSSSSSPNATNTNLVMWVKSATNPLTSHILNDAYILFHSQLLKVTYQFANLTTNSKASLNLTSIDLDAVAADSGVAVSTATVSHQVVSEKGDMFYILDRLSGDSPVASLNLYCAASGDIRSIDLPLGRAWNLTASALANVVVMSLYHNETASGLNDPNQVDLPEDRIVVYDYSLFSDQPLWQITLTQLVSSLSIDLPFASPDRHFQNVRLDQRHLFVSLTSRYLPDVAPLLSLLAVFNATNGVLVRYFPLYTIPQPVGDGGTESACELRAGPQEQAHSMLYECNNQLMLITPTDARWVVLVDDDFNNGDQTQPIILVQNPPNNSNPNFTLFQILLPVLLGVFVCCCLTYCIGSYRSHHRSLRLLKDLDAASSMLSFESDPAVFHIHDFADSLVLQNQVSRPDGNLHADLVSAIESGREKVTAQGLEPSRTGPSSAEFEPSTGSKVLINQVDLDPKEQSVSRSSSGFRTRSEIGRAMDLEGGDMQNEPSQSRSDGDHFVYEVHAGAGGPSPSNRPAGSASTAVSPSASVSIAHDGGAVPGSATSRDAVLADAKIQPKTKKGGRVIRYDEE